MKQEVTRKHTAQKWALNDIVYHTEVTNFERFEQIKAPPEEGIYIHGLYLDGAAWSRQESSLVESAPKQLFAPLPVLHITAVERKLEEKALRILPYPYYSGSAHGCCLPSPKNKRQKIKIYVGISMVRQSA